MKRYRRTSILEAAPSTSVLNRVWAKAIDVVVLAGTFYCVSWFSPLLGWIATIALASFQDSLGNGQSIGKRIIGLRVADEPTGLPCTFYQSFLRNLPFFISLTVSALAWFKTVGILLGGVLVLAELYLLILLPSGVRLGDVYANTQVLEVNPDEALFL